MRSRKARRSFARVAKFDHGTPIWRPNMAAVTGLTTVLMFTALLSGMRLPDHVLLFSQPMYPNYFGAPYVMEKTVAVRVDRRGSIYWNGREVDRSHLQAHFQELTTFAVEPVTVLLPDRDAPYGETAKVLLEFHKVGLTKLCLSGIWEHRRFDKAWEHYPMRLTILPPMPGDAAPGPPPTGSEICADPRGQKWSSR